MTKNWQQLQKGYIGLIALLIVVVIIGIWFAMGAKNMLGGVNGLTATSSQNDQIAPSSADESAIQKAKDANAQIEAGYQNLSQ